MDPYTARIPHQEYTPDRFLTPRREAAKKKRIINHKPHEIHEKRSRIIIACAGDIMELAKTVPQGGGASIRRRFAGRGMTANAKIHRRGSQLFTDKCYLYFVSWMKEL
jgi:hypothetical protein